MNTIVVTHHLRQIWTGAIHNLSSIKKTLNCATWRGWCRSRGDLNSLRTRRSQRVRPLGCKKNTSMKSSVELTAMHFSLKSVNLPYTPKNRLYLCSIKNLCSSSNRSNMRCSILRDSMPNPRSAWLGKMISATLSGLITTNTAARKSQTCFWKTWLTKQEMVKLSKVNLLSM